MSIISDKTSSSPEKEVIDGISITRIDRLMLKFFFRRKEFRALILKNKPDVIVWQGTPQSAIYLNHLRTIGKPIIWDIDIDLQHLINLNRISIRDLFHTNHTFLLLQLLVIIPPKYIIRRIANSALISKIIVPSQHNKRSLSKIGVRPNKIDVISSTIDKTDFTNFEGEGKNLFRSTMGFEPLDFIVTYFGSPCTLRGTDIAVQSLTQIITLRKNAKLLILSRRKLNKYSSKNKDHLEKEEDYLRKLIRRRDLDRNVLIISGEISKTRLKSLLLMSDVIVLPFKIVQSEPPLSVLEAMRLGKVVVTTNLGTLAEIVADGRGILVEPNSANALTQAIMFLTNHPEKSKLIREAAQRFAETLPDWDHVALKFEELLNGVLPRKADHI